MTTSQPIAVPRTSWRYRILRWFYKREEQFPQTSCGMRAGTIVQPMFYIAACLLLLALAVSLLFIAVVGLALGVDTWPEGSVVPLGLGALNLLLFAFAIKWPRLWWCYAVLGVTITTLALATDLKMADQLWPHWKFQFIWFGTGLGLYVAAIVTMRWWLLWVQRLYQRYCKPVTYV